MKAHGKSLKAAIAWCLFDWANSPYATLITTFVFSAYFTKAVAASPEEGTALWGWAAATAGFLVAILGPLCGALADHAGPRKPWLAGFSALCIAGTAGLWFVAPDVAFVPLALGLVVVSTVGYEMATVFYNAQLPDVAPPGKLGRLSGWAWGLGYVGGLVALVIALFGFVQVETPPFGLDKAQAEHVRATALLVAAWYALFALPTLLWVPDVPRRETGGRAFRHALTDLKHLWRTLRCHPTIARYLVARMLFTDGINTLFTFGGIYAAGTFGMALPEVIMLGIALNVTAGAGAAAFGWMDDKVGARPTIVVGLLAVMGIGFALLVVNDKSAFWGLAVALGLFFGPIQSASRTLLVRLAPGELMTEMFGLYALSGKVTAFLGPLVLGWATLAFDSQRAGMATILVFLAAGLWLLRGVREG